MNSSTRGRYFAVKGEESGGDGFEEEHDTSNE
jgi:hypothetical protein